MFNKKFLVFILERMDFWPIGPSYCPNQILTISGYDCLLLPQNILFRWDHEYRLQHKDPILLYLERLHELTQQRVPLDVYPRIKISRLGANTWQIQSIGLMPRHVMNQVRNLLENKGWHTNLEEEEMNAEWIRQVEEWRELEWKVAVQDPVRFRSALDELRDSLVQVQSFQLFDRDWYFLPAMSPRVQQCFQKSQAWHGEISKLRRAAWYEGGTHWEGRSALLRWYHLARERSAACHAKGAVRKRNRHCRFRNSGKGCRMAFVKLLTRLTCLPPTLCDVIQGYDSEFPCLQPNQLWLFNPCAEQSHLQDYFYASFKGIQGRNHTPLPYYFTRYLEQLCRE